MTEKIETRNSKNKIFCALPDALPKMGCITSKPESHTEGYSQNAPRRSTYEHSFLKRMEQQSSHNHHSLQTKSISPTKSSTETKLPPTAVHRKYRPSGTTRQHRAPRLVPGPIRALGRIAFITGLLVVGVAQHLEQFVDHPGIALRRPINRLLRQIVA